MAGETTQSNITDKELSLLLLHQLVPGTGYNNLPVTVQADTRIQWWPLQEAVHHLLRRQPALRTVYTADDTSFSKRVLAPDEASAQVAVVTTTAAELTGELGKFASRPFPLSDEPMVRVGMFQYDGGGAICLVAHHLVFDGASMNIVMAELISLYNHFCLHSEPPAGPAVTTQTAPERTPTAESRDYWRRHLDGADPSLAKVDCGGPEPAVPTLNGAILEFILPDAARTAARQLRRQLGVTESVVYQAAFYSLLARHGAGRDLVIGVPMDLRTSSTRSSVGYHVNTVALRTEVDPDASFRQLAHRVRDNMFAGMAHSDVAIDSLGVFPSNPEKWRTNTFRYMFNYLPVPVAGELVVDGAPARMIGTYNGSSRYDFEFIVAAGAEHISIMVVYSLEIHDRADIEAMAHRYAELLCSAVAGPETPVGELAIMTDRDRAVVSRTGPDDSRADPATLVEAIARQARATPDAAALRSPTRTLSYSRLWAWAEEIAGELRSAGMADGEPIILPSADLDARVAALLGAWLAGCTYLATGATGDRMPGREATALTGRVVRFTQTPEPASGNGATALVLPPAPRTGSVPAPATCRPTDSAMVVPGSDPSAGETRRVPHSILMAMVRGLAERLDVPGSHTVTLSTSSTVDAIIADVLVPISVGGCTLWGFTAARTGAAELCATVVEHDVRVVRLTPVQARLVAGQPDNRLAGRTLVCAGREVPTEVVDRLVDVGATVFRAYSSPTTGLWLTCGAASSGTHPGWVGQPLGHASATVTDTHGRLLPPGIRGRLSSTGSEALVRWDGGIEIVSAGSAEPDIDPAPAEQPEPDIGPALGEQPDIVGEPADAGATEPADELLAQVTALWRELLDQPELSPDDNFFAAGGQSVLAVRVLQRTGRTLGFRVPPDALVRAPTARSFARRLAVLRAERNG